MTAFSPPTSLLLTNSYALNLLLLLLLLYRLLTTTTNEPRTHARVSRVTNNIYFLISDHRCRVIILYELNSNYRRDDDDNDVVVFTAIGSSLRSRSR